MNLVETVNRNEGFASLVVLANGKRPKSHYHTDSVGKVYKSEVKLVPVWNENMKKHYTSGSKLPKWDHTKVLQSKRGAWLFEYVKQGNKVALSMIYIDTATMKETMFDNITVQGTHENCVLIIPPLPQDQSKMLGELLGVNGALSKAFRAGLRRLLDPEWNSFYDWTGNESDNGN